jgi:hypothetical protein
MWLRIFSFLSIFLYLGQFPVGYAMQKNKMTVQCKDVCDCESDSQEEQHQNNAENQNALTAWKPVLNQYFIITDKKNPDTQLGFIRSGHFIPEFPPPDFLILFTE